MDSAQRNLHPETLPGTAPLQFPPQVTAAIIAVIAFLIGMLAMQLPGQFQTVQVEGILEYPTRNIHVPFDAVIKQHHVATGDFVRPEQLLVELESPMLNAEIAAAESELEQLRLTLAQREADAEVEIAWRLRELDTDALNVQMATARLHERKFQLEYEGLAWNDVETLSTLQSFPEPSDLFRATLRNPVSPDGSRLHALLKQDSVRNAAEVTTAQIEMYEARLDALEKLHANLPEKIRVKAGIEAASADVKRAESRLQKLNSQLADLTLKSDAWGQVVFNTESNSGIIATIYDLDIPSIRMPVSPQIASKLKAGDNIEVDFGESDSHTGRVGSIASVSRRTADGKTVVDVTIEPSGRLWPVRPAGSSIVVRN